MGLNSSPSQLARRASWAVLALLAVAPGAGCATKHDIRDLHDAIVALQLRQDSLMALVRAQNAILVDSIGSQRDALFQVRGDLGNELAQLEQQHVQIMQLTGESQRGLVQLRDQIAARRAQLAGSGGGTVVDTTTSAGAASSPSGTVAGLYRIGVENLNRGATETARQAFRQIVQNDQDSTEAPAAQFMLAETYYKDKKYDTAMRELERVVEMFPGSDRAPAALYRAGIIAEQQGAKAKAREYFRRVISGYPKSDEAKQAAEELRRLRR